MGTFCWTLSGVQAESPPAVLCGVGRIWSLRFLSVGRTRASGIPTPPPPTPSYRHGADVLFRRVFFVVVASTFCLLVASLSYDCIRSRFCFVFVFSFVFRLSLFFPLCFHSVFIGGGFNCFVLFLFSHYFRFVSISLLLNVRRGFLAYVSFSFSFSFFRSRRILCVCVCFFLSNQQREQKLGMLLERHDEWPDGREQRSERAIVKMVVDCGPAQVLFLFHLGTDPLTRNRDAGRLRSRSDRS